MQVSRFWLGIIVLCEAWLFACGSSDDCVRLTPSSRRCARPGYAADPPPPAAVPSRAGGAPSTTWSISTPERSLPYEPFLNETVWAAARPPFGAYDFIALRRIAPGGEGQAVQPRPVFVFLPGAHFHGEIVIPDERGDLRLYLAKHGVETWTIDYRTHFVPREQISDSQFMQTWSAEMFVDDVIFALSQVRTISQQPAVFLGGFGLGATFAALAAARTNGDGLAGLILLDGYVLDPPDAESLYRQRTPTPNWFADDLESRSMPYKRWIKILQDVIDDPAGPDFFPTPMFDNRAQALAHLLYVNGSFGGRGGLSNAKNGRADIRLLARILQQQDRYWPRVQNHGGFVLKQHLADSAFDYEQAFRSLRLPLLAFASDTMDNAGIEWSERVQFTAQATAASDTEYHVLHEWGHLDVLWGTTAVHDVFAPIAAWIMRRQEKERRESAQSARGG